MSKQTDALKLALEALEEIADEVFAPYDNKLGGAILAIREALAQPEQEPVAWRYRSVSPFVGKDGTYKVSDGWTLIRKPEKRDAHSAMCGMEAEPLYTTPQPQREWVGLTDEEIFEIHKQVDSMQYLTFGKAIEAKLKEKNT